ncbi:ABC transporter permease, partial [Archaeoglobales archaeon]
LIDSLSHIFLPALVLGIVLSGAYTRLLRNNLIDVLSQDFIVAYRARGVRERKVVKHAMKNAFIPVITLMGLQFAILLAGAVLTETTFSWPGMGTFLLERIQYRDYTSVQGAIVFYALFVALISLIVDIVYALLDPRIRY